MIDKVIVLNLKATFMMRIRITEYQKKKQILLVGKHEQTSVSKHQ